jgi:F-type H+-transporting ATPase subunit b
MLNLIAQFGDSGSGLSSLGLDGQSFLIQLVTFIIALLVLRRWAFKPIIRIMNERRDTIEKGVSLGQQMEKDKAELEVKAEKILHDARNEADKIVAEAQEASRQSIREAETQAKDKAETILESAQDRIKQEAAKAKKQLEGEIVGLVSEATEALVREKVDAKKDASLIEKFLSEQRSAS